MEKNDFGNGKFPSDESYLKKENINNEIGACVFFKSFGLRIAKKSDGKISRIEVIRAIH